MFIYFTKFKFYLFYYFTLIYFLFMQKFWEAISKLSFRRPSITKKSYFSGPFVFNEKKNKKALENFENEILIKSNNEKIMKFNISGLSRYSKIR